MHRVKRLALKLIQTLLFALAGRYRAKITGPVIAIVGTVGKTTTKDAIGIVARQQFGYDSCFVTAKSLNAEIGVPLTLMGFTQVPRGLGWLTLLVRATVVAFWGVAVKAAVVELGEENPGDIAAYARLARPTHLIITEVAEAHSAYLGTPESVVREIVSAIAFVAPTGTIIVNGDNAFLRDCPVGPHQKKIVVRLRRRGDYFISNIAVDLDGTRGILHHRNRTQRVTLGLFGEHQMYVALFMAAIADCLGMRPTGVQKLYKQVRPAPGRGRMLNGKNGSIILDESYNAAPAAMEAALITLRALPAKRRVAILGDMRELATPDSHHETIGKLARDVCDHVIAVGPLSKMYRANEWFLTASGAVPSALRQLGPGVIVLVKGSQNTIRLERVVKELLANPADSAQLVRQEPWWQTIP